MHTLVSVFFAQSFLPKDTLLRTYSTVEVVSSVVDEASHNYSNIEAVDIDPCEPLVNMIEIYTSTHSVQFHYRLIHGII